MQKLQKILSGNCAKIFNSTEQVEHVWPASVVLLVACSMRCLATVIGESAFEAQSDQIIVSGYSGV